MSALVLLPNDAVYKFKDAAHIPAGVTVEGVLAERQAILQRYQRVTIKESAEEVLAHPEVFPNLRAFAPDDAEEALRLAVQEGIRHAYRSVVEVITERVPRGEDRTVEIRVFHAVPTEGSDALSYESIEVIRVTPSQRRFLINQLRRDATAFAEKVKLVLAELATLDTF